MTREQQPTVITIPREDLIQWAVAARAGKNPKVPYGGDPMGMMEDAYRERGRLLDEILDGIEKHLDPPPASAEEPKCSRCGKFTIWGPVGSFCWNCLRDLRLEPTRDT